MKYKELIGICKNCFGCNRLADENFVGTYNCIWYVKAISEKEQTNDNKNTASVQK